MDSRYTGPMAVCAQVPLKTRFPRRSPVTSGLVESAWRVEHATPMMAAAIATTQVSRFVCIGNTCSSPEHHPSVMPNPIRPFSVTIALLSLLGLAAPADSQGYDPSLFQEMRWRMIGPFRASRTKAGTGVPSQPSVFYIGVVNGGVWKTNDFGRTWTPIFDDQPTGSIGAIAIAPSDPNVVYVGSGEGLQRPDLSTGDGIYKSTDAGKTWTHLGLRDGQQIPQIVVDPKNPDRLFVAVLGHPYGPNDERGIFRSTDGGATFSKVLYKDENTGAIDVVLDPVDARIIYCVLWEARQGPWENSTWNGTDGGIFKSTDGGKTWNQLRQGLPEKIVQANLAVAPSSPKTLLAAVRK